MPATVVWEQTDVHITSSTYRSLLVLFLLSQFRFSDFSDISTIPFCRFRQLSSSQITILPTESIRFLWTCLHFIVHTENFIFLASSVGHKCWMELITSTSITLEVQNQKNTCNCWHSYNFPFNYEYTVILNKTENVAIENICNPEKNIDFVRTPLFPLAIRIDCYCKSPCCFGCNLNALRAACCSCWYSYFVLYAPSPATLSARSWKWSPNRFCIMHSQPIVMLLCGRWIEQKRLPQITKNRNE